MTLPEGEIGSFRLVAWSLLFLFVVSAPGAANAISTDSTWELTVDDPGDGCRFTGPMTLTQSGSNLNGMIALGRVLGVSPCPTGVSGPVSGTLVGSTITFGFTYGGFGTATFSGTVSPDGKLASGTWSLNAPNSGSGTWFAENADVTFTITLTVTSTLDGCQWSGPGTATASTVVPPFAGSIGLTKVAGPASCSPTLSGPVKGEVIPPDVNFVLKSAELGDLSFVGTLNGTSASGTWSGDPVGGTWFAGGFPGGRVAAPALNGIALATLLALLVAAGVFCARRRSHFASGPTGRPSRIWSRYSDMP